jgi:transposase InsO family protein
MQELRNYPSLFSSTHTKRYKLERFNRTVQKEWLDYSIVGLDILEEANNDLTAWLEIYNNVRLHAALGYKTPLQYMEEPGP